MCYRLALVQQKVKENHCLRDRLMFEWPLGLGRNYIDTHVLIQFAVLTFNYSYSRGSMEDLRMIKLSKGIGQKPQTR